MRVLSAFVLLAAFCAQPVASASELREVKYQGFTIWLDCERRTAVRFEYHAGRDIGSLPREDDFDLDPGVAAECQQIEDRSYRSNSLNEPNALEEQGWTYDRGHLVPANHLDHLPEGIRQSNFMTNILPQASAMNRGAWLATEEITECWRDVTPLNVQGGIIHGWNPHDDFFVESHGIETPDYFWKVISREDAVIAWIIPNSPEARRGELDRYLVTPAEIETATRVELDVPESQKHTMPERSWSLPDSCNKG